MKYTFRTRPYRHQLEALKHLLRHDGGALFMEMGTMKTKVWIDWCNCVALKNGGRVPKAAALVVAPLGVLGTWDKEIDRHDPYWDNDFMGVEWALVNYDIVWRPHMYDELVEWLHEFEPEQRLIIADESHSIKNHAARRSKALHRLAAHADHRSIGTGTHAPKHPLDLYSQFKFLRPNLFPSRWAEFRSTYAVFQSGTPIVRRFKNLRKLNKKIRPYVYYKELDDCVDLPKAVDNIIPVQLTGENLRVYEELAEQFVTDFEDLEMEVPHVLTRLMRLQQITGGWLVHKDDQEQQWRKRVGRDKLQAYEELLGQLQEQGRRKVVVFARFLDEVNDVGWASKRLGYKVLTVHGGNRKLRERIFTAFEKTRKPTVIVVQIGTGSMGRNELVVARDAVFYSIDFSYDHLDQAKGRLRRPGQKHKVVYHYLLSMIDYEVLDSHKHKRNLAKRLVQNPKLVYNVPVAAKRRRSYSDPRRRAA